MYLCVCTCVYIYIYMYILGECYYHGRYVCVHGCTYIPACAYIYANTHINMCTYRRILYEYICIYIQICQTSMHIYWRFGMYVCMYVCMYICIHVCTHRRVLRAMYAYTLEYVW